MNNIGFTLHLPCPDPRIKPWGDYYYYGRSLANALERLGCVAKLKYHKRRTLRTVIAQALDRRKTNVDLVLRGFVPLKPTPGRPQILWLISHPEDIDASEIENADHVFVASQTHAARLVSEGHKNVSPLLQCTDSELFRPFDAVTRGSIVFVGNRRQEFLRDVVAWTLEEGVDLKVWGRGWAKILSRRHFRGKHVKNHLLARVYAGAAAVLNDHARGMLAYGFISNRVFDVLAAGGRIVTNLPEALPEDIAGAEGTALFPFTDRESFRSALGCALSAPDELTSRRLLAERVRHMHSFDARAKVIVEKAKALLKEGSLDG